MSILSQAMAAKNARTSLREMRETDLAFVFLDWSWSQQSKDGKAILDRWVAARQLPLPLFVLDCDRDEAAARWLTDECMRTKQPLHGGGHGTLLIAAMGRVVSWVREVHGCADREIDNALATVQSHG